jgi:Tetracyclin repressor-like, C-terminal domain
MFDPHLLRMSDVALGAERDVAFGNFFTAVRETTGAQDAEQVATQALAAWSVVHGVAVLWLQGNLPYPAEAGCVPDVIAQLGAGLRTVAVASAAHLPEHLTGLPRASELPGAGGGQRDEQDGDHGGGDVDGDDQDGRAAGGRGASGQRVILRAG